MSYFHSILVVVVAVPLFAQGPAPNTNQASTGASPAGAADISSDKVVLTIGSEKMTVKEFEQFVESLPEQYRTMARGPGKRQIVDQLVSIKTMAQEARRRKLDETPSYKRQLTFQADNILAGVLFQNLSESLTVDEAAERKYYTDHTKDYEKVKARHILVRMKGSPVPVPSGKQDISDEEALAKAKAIRVRLAAGEDFATVAKTESDDVTSGVNGGELGTFGHGQMVPAFEQAAFALPVGQISEPVKTQFGYHLIKIDTHESKTFDEVKPELEKKLRPDLARKEVDRLRKQANVVIDDGFFGPSPAK